MQSKKQKGQFYTVNADYILNGLDFPPNNEKIIEPFVGKGDLIKNITNVISYDIEPKVDNAVVRDTLLNPPNYKDSWVITNPPFLARNKSSDKTIFNKYNTNDLYKCAIKSILDCKGGILIIPAGFFFSDRNIDSELRKTFMKTFEITKVKYFEETVFPDTTTTVVAFSFVRSNIPLTEQNIEWLKMPHKISKIFNVELKNNWIIGGEIHNIPKPKFCICRYVVDNKKSNEFHLTNITLNALDSGNINSRISLQYKKDYIYKGKETSRTYATIMIKNVILSEDQQQRLCIKFNEFIEDRREKYWSLFLPQYRESKEYARKRIPFDLAYKIIGNIIETLTN